MTTTLTFDRDKLIQDLTSLQSHHRIAFAAACCERLLPDYKAFSLVEHWGDYQMLRHALDRIWQLLEGEDVPRSELQRLQATCVPLIPDADDFGSVLGNLARDASAAVVTTLDCCLDDSPEAAAGVAELATETIDGYLFVVGDPIRRPHSVAVAVDDWIQRSPLMQDELAQQQRDLETLRRHAVLPQEVLRNLRERSAERGIQIIGRGLVKGDG